MSTYRDTTNSMADDYNKTDPEYWYNKVLMLNNKTFTTYIGFKTEQYEAIKKELEWLEKVEKALKNNCEET